MKRILLAAGLIAALHTPALADQWWSLYRSNPSSGVLDACGSDVPPASPSEGFAYLSQQGYIPHYEDKGDEVDVVFKQDPNGYYHYFIYFRTYGACQGAAQRNIADASKYQ
jgi:hypothetical protein